MQAVAWAQVMDQARRVAAHLQAKGVQPGDRVALINKNTAWWWLTGFAIWLAGGVLGPLRPTLAVSTIRQILIDSEAKLRVIGKVDGWAAMRPGVRQRLHCITTPLAPPPGALPSGTEAGASSLARTQPLAGQPVCEGTRWPPSCRPPAQRAGPRA